jgi:hypothetical protein
MYEKILLVMQLNKFLNKKSTCIMFMNIFYLLDIENSNWGKRSELFLWTTLKFPKVLPVKQSAKIGPFSGKTREEAELCGELGISSGN